MWVDGLNARTDLNKRAAKVCKPAPRADGRIGIEMVFGKERVWIKAANPNATTPTVLERQQKKLFIACQNGDLECLCAVLLKAGRAQCVRALLEDGLNALMIAAQNGHEQVARVLLEAGANIEATEEDGWTALMLACHPGAI